MKTTYRIFSKVWFLNIVAILMMLFTLQMIVVCAVGLTKNGLSQFWSSNDIYIIFFFIYLLLDIWILTATFLPIIKINREGISAYSLFWKRKIKWEQVQNVKLLKASNRRSGGGTLGRASISFEITDEPETKNNAMMNKGIRVSTFILVSMQKSILPTSLSLGGQLLTHGKIATAEEIAFEYDDTAWQIIQNKQKNP